MTFDVRRVGTTGSTNDDALALARAGAPHGTVVLAEAQTHGRGRQGRAWMSPPGENLYLSVLLRPAIAPHRAPPLTLAAAVAVCAAAAQLGCRAAIKWPNDVLVDGKKLAGVLTESTSRGGRLEAVVVGIGVNVNWTAIPPELSPSATSLALALGHPVDRERVAQVLLVELERWLAAEPTEVARTWRQLSDTLGRRVKSAEGEGWARDLDDDGALRVELDDGRMVYVRSGEIS
jgi:BirA family biotin operon repressor/biotin-[acetyl-CoA-carboxylase] ligase